MDLEAVGEGTALLVDHAAGGGDDERGIGELKLANAVFDHLAALCSWRRAAQSTLARDSRRHTEEQPDEVGIVDVEIDERAADFFWIPKVLEPERVRDDALEMAAEQLTVFAAIDCLAGVGVLGQE